MESEPMRVIEFDFATRVDRQVTIDEAADVRANGFCYWIDIDLRTCPNAEDALRRLGINPAVIESSLASASAARYVVYEDCIHVFVTEPTLASNRVEFARVDMIFGDRVVITLSRDDVQFLARSRQNYRSFFQEYAQSLGFLVFEFWSGLIDTYQSTFVRFEDDVEAIRETIFANVNDEIFGHVSESIRDLLRLRRNVIADRETLQQLALHKTGFVSKTTQPYLAKMVGMLDRLASDIAIEREVLTETLTLYLGIVTHGTNQILSRLTVISVIFLPLTFLVGLYGMNFRSQPEFEWAHGYAFFWVMAALIFISSVVFIRIKRWF